MLLLCASCGGESDPKPVVEAPARVHDARPKTVIDIATIVPKEPSVFGPWAKIAIGTSRGEIEKTAPALVNGTISRTRSPGTYEVDAGGQRLTDDSETPRFGGVMVDGRLAAYTIVLDARGIATVEAAWGPPRTITSARGKTHTLWATEDAHLERSASEGGTTTLTVTKFVPLASFLGKKRFAFEETRSLVGLPAAEAIAQIQRWADVRRLAVTVEGDIESMAKTVGDATNTSVTPDKVIIVGGDGTTTPLSSMPTRSIDVSLPPTEGSFEALEYNFTRVRIWLDDKGVVSHYWFDVWLDRAGYTSATALLAKAFGRPTKIGAHLRYPTKPVVCFPAEPRAYATISVGQCK